MGVVLGIDLGTTFSAVAVVNGDNKAEIIPNREGERITPSVVMFDGDAPIVGTIAKQSAVTNPLNVVQFVKRQMGNPSWKFRTEGGESFTAEEISAIILRRLREDAEAALGETVSGAVITVPAYFNDGQRKATQDAGRIAGLNVLRIISEPTAAALAYAFDTLQKSAAQADKNAMQRVQHEQTVLVYDLGGGTFDVTIMRLGKGGVEVIATGGDKNLGGFNWDNEIMMFLNEEFKKQGGPDLVDEPELEQQLRDKAEVAKKTLSARDKANVLLSAGGKNVSLVLSRADFEAVTAPLLKRTRSIMEFVLEDAGLKWSEIDKVLLTGGSTRMKAVPLLVEAVTGKKPSTELHPDEIVAMGAAVQGAMIAAEEAKHCPFPIVRVSDVTAHSMGLVAMDEDENEHNSIVLPRNTPFGQTETRDGYVTRIEKQPTFLLQVTEGEGEELSGVRIIIEEEISLPAYPKGAGFEMSFQWDLDGMVHISIFDQTAGRPLKNVEFRRKNSMTEQEVQAKKLKLSKREVN